MPKLHTSADPQDREIALERTAGEREFEAVTLRP
jgi:hypothetical protein